jgi:hypothetical protein
MNTLRCSAINKKGENCKNYKYSDSEYCYLHNLIRKGSLKFYKNPKIHFFFAIIAIGLALYFGIGGATKENQEVIISNQETQSQDIQKIKELLLADMANILKQREDEFLKTYELGFQLVAFDRYNNVIPFDSRIRFDFQINWDKTELIKLSSSRLRLKLPNIKDLRYGHDFHDNDITFDEGTLGFIGSITFSSFRLVVEGLDYEYYGYICLIGLLDINNFVK